jgi:WD40 repeat protein
MEFVIILAGVSPGFHCGDTMPRRAPEGYVRRLLDLGPKEGTYAMAFSRNGDYLWAGGNRFNENGKAVISRWRLASKTSRDSLGTDLSAVIRFLDCSPAGYVVAGDDDGNVNVLSDTGRVAKSFLLSGSQPSQMLAVKLCDDQNVMAIVYDGILSKWSMTGNTKLYTLPTRHMSKKIYVAAIGNLKNQGVWRDSTSLFFWNQMLVHPDRVDISEMAIPRQNIDYLAISDDGRRIMCAAEGGKLVVVDSGSRKVVKEWQGHPVDVVSLIALNGNRGFVSGDYRGEIRIWSMEGEELARIRNGANPVSSLAIDLQNARLASAGPNQVIAIWDISTTKGVGLER